MGWNPGSALPGLRSRPSWSHDDAPSASCSRRPRFRPPPSVPLGVMAPHLREPGRLTGASWHWGGLGRAGLVGIREGSGTRFRHMGFGGKSLSARTEGRGSPSPRGGLRCWGRQLGWVEDKLTIPTPTKQYAAVVK